jgi:cytochrome c-type biogenesis protein CcmH
LKYWIALVMLLAPLAASYAQSSLPPSALADTQLPDARQEAAARRLMEDIKCLVCAGQSVADSNAEMAGDMRALIRGKIAAGEKPAAVKAWLIERYGNGITYAPPLGAETALLWGAPFILLGFALWFVRGRIKVRKR